MPPDENSAPIKQNSLFFFFFPQLLAASSLSPSVTCAVGKLGCWGPTAPTYLCLYLKPFLKSWGLIDVMSDWPSVFRKLMVHCVGHTVIAAHQSGASCCRPFPSFGIHMHQFDKMLDNRCWSLCFDKEDTTLKSNDKSLFKTCKSDARVLWKPVWQLPLLLYFFKTHFLFCFMYAMLEIGYRAS